MLANFRSPLAGTLLRSLTGTWLNLSKLQMVVYQHPAAILVSALLNDVK